MSNFMKTILSDVERTIESRCNNVRAECGLDMCTGNELCHAEICASKCPMKPFVSLLTIQEANETFKSISTEVGK